jgi:predicted outer membrane repeat protein
MSVRTGRWLALCLLVGAVGAVAVPQASGVTTATRYVVSTGADADNDCTDSANPCAGLQYAIDQASAGDTIDVAGTLDSNVTIAESLTVTQWPGQASAVLDGTNSGTVVTINGGASVSVTLSDLTIENGNSSSDGGGVASLSGAALTVDNTTFSSNSANDLGGGGGIASEGGGMLTVDHSTFVNNSSASGGAIFNSGALATDDSTFSGNSSTPEGGGAIIEENGSGSVLRSTFTDNSSPGSAEGSNGGALYIDGNFAFLVADSTFTDNSAGLYGGAIANGDSLTVESSTFTGNSAGSGGAAIATATVGMQLATDIFAKQASGANCAFLDGTQVNDLIDAGYNVDDDGTCGLSSANHSVPDSSAIDDYLGTLANNGGPTETVALLRKPSPATPAADPALAVVPGSFQLPQAIDGKTAACSVPDQRGVSSPTGAHCDIGAYQTSPPSAPRALTGRLAHDSLHLSWKASHDNLGVRDYVVYLGTTRIKTLAGTSITVAVRRLHRHGASVLTVRAFDKEGNRSEASNAVTAIPTQRPASVPKRIPRWAWRLLNWQEHHIGARPSTPHPLPKWYASWKRWQENLFRLVD